MSMRISHHVGRAAGHPMGCEWSGETGVSGLVDLPTRYALSGHTLDNAQREPRIRTL